MKKKASYVEYFADNEAFDNKSYNSFVQGYRK